ncbi:HdeA/HdeB family chaperone [Nitrosomonas sp. Nm132]|uniref:HdeA/HdeB family chaperone n=1 Tax=Nitrosomonas sp. Nm132 TaxID=1881053 RepID=UPI0008861AED|nr:HdeA/HdeB family chaperone [Nitrosomonas sp. Nm132]SDI03049.1 HdeA/HdeB family protein [Nitrosomonas sp. Nm132]
MKINVTMAVLSGVLLSATVTTPVLAGATHKPAKMTCEEFLALDDVVKPKVVYWAEGFNKKGEPTDFGLDVVETDRLVPVLVTECKKTPKHSFLKKTKEHSAETQKPAATPKTAAIPKPANITCEEFLALDDVLKPKVVYWAEGFNKKDKPIEYVLDVDKTDRLVPVIVIECKETPKLSFWQKIMKHF